jgi:ESCRT-I complex subunit VPS28
MTSNGGSGGRWPMALDKSLSEIDLFDSSKERKAYENCADLYAIITATEHLERAFASDAITNTQYTTECNKLISQFKIAEKAALGNNKMTTETFMKIYQMDCPRAAERLLRMGVPEPMRSSDNSGNVAISVAETVQHFITAMDNVKLDRLDVDELQPLLSELMNALVQLPDTPNDWAPNHKVKKWLVQLNSMRAYERIDEDDGRQLYHDLDSAYLEFTQYLKTKR